MKSWKTTLGGTITSAGAACIAVPTLQTQFPSMALLPSEWLKWFVLVGVVLTIAGPAVHGLFSRDNDKSSEDVGCVKKKETP